MRGFVTVATGDEKYYKMAADLLLSYRTRGQGACPFAGVYTLPALESDLRRIILKEDCKQWRFEIVTD